MRRRRRTPEQIVGKLAEADKLLGWGQQIEEVRRHLEITESTFHRWRNQYGGMKADDAKRLKDLERENARLKKIVTDPSSRGRWHPDVRRGAGRGAKCR